MSAFEEKSGKINSSVFKSVLLDKCGYNRKEVQIGPEFGVDTSVIHLGNDLGMAISSDPLSLIPSMGLKESAWLSVYLLANDMATTGFSPMYAQFVLNLPTSLTLEDFKEYWGYIHTFCEDIGVSITGGHTGQIEGQNSTISGGGTMFLTAPIQDILTGNNASPGDRIIVTKETALTASSILAMSFPETIINNLGKEVYDRGCENFYRTSSLNDGLYAAEILKPNKELTAMHDVTEGGILGGISEMAEASGCSFTVYDDQLPVGDVQQQITGFFGIDHRFCVGAGSMIMTVKAGKENNMIKGLNSKGIKATLVGEMTEKENGNKLIMKGDESDFFFDGKDPYWEAFFSAINKGFK